MSDAPQGPGWWMGTDGKFYPPAAPPPPARKSGGGCLKAVLLVGGVFAAAVVVVVLITIIGSTSTTSSGSASKSPAGASGKKASDTTFCKDTPLGEEIDTNVKRSSDRPDQQSDDHEALLGDCVRVHDFAAYVNSVESRSDATGDKVMVANVTVTNRKNGVQPYNQFDWKVITPSGRIEDPTIFFGEMNSLGSGDLVSGGTATGDVAMPFEGPGAYYIIFEPGIFDDDRGVWAVTASP